MRIYHFFVGFILGIVILSTTINASAALISQDDSTFGSGAFTKDTNTGLQWLDLSLTLNESMNYIKSNSGAGGSYSGLRYATQDEVIQFFFNAGISPVIGTSYTKTGYDAGRGLLDLMGLNHNCVMYGITGTGPVNQYDVYIGAYIYVDADASDNSYITSSNIGAYTQSVPFTSTYQEPYLGSFLVRDTPVEPVPEPSTFLLLAPVLVFFSLKRKTIRW